MTSVTGRPAAVAWLADVLREAGATTRLAEFPVTGTVREVYGVPTLNWPAGGAGALVFRRDVCERLASADLPDPQTGRLSTMDDADVTGAWVLDGHAPPSLTIT